MPSSEKKGRATAITIPVSSFEIRSELIKRPFIHLDIIDDQVWIQPNDTESGIADEPQTAGIPKDLISS